MQIEKLPFPLIDEVLLNFSPFSSQINAADPKLLKDSLLEKVVTRIYLGFDNDILQIHYDFLSKELLKLFKSVNKDFDIKSGNWQFLNKQTSGNHGQMPQFKTLLEKLPI